MIDMERATKLFNRLKELEKERQEVQMELARLFGGVPVDQRRRRGRPPGAESLPARALGLMKEQPGRVFKVVEVAAALEASPRTTNTVLLRLLKKKSVQRKPEGGYFYAG